MSKNIGFAISFVVGVVVGVAATYRVANQKYQNIADAEIASVIETFTNRKPMFKEESNEVEDMKDSIDEPADDRFSTSNKGAVKEFKENSARVGYDRISTQPSKPKRGKKNEPEPIPDEEVDTNYIYIISPDDFNTLDGFKVATFYYSADNQVLDEDCEVLSDSEIVRTIGHDPYGHFGEYEDSSVYVRNEQLMCDYEILLSLQTAAELSERR